jgi:hypothetical protein
MSQFDRNYNMLWRNNVITSRLPINDIPTVQTDKWMFFEDGTHEYYDLFRSEAKINTYKSLYWHLLVLWYLNPEKGPDEFKQMSYAICNKSNGFISFSINDNMIDKIVYDVYMSDLDRPPKNKLRKVIFKRGCGLSKAEKLSIVGQLIGRSNKTHPDDVYQAMIDIHDLGQKITIKRVSEVLGVSSRTVHRHMCEDLKREKELLNKQL